MINPEILALLDIKLQSAHDKIALGNITRTTVEKDFREPLLKIKREFKVIFNIVLPDELSFDEILALAYEQLQAVYHEWEL